MTNAERNVLDDLVEDVRDFLERLREVLNPNHKRRQPVRVPVPVDNRNPSPRRYREE